MGGCIKPIGGEHWFDIQLFDNELDNFNDTKATFLRGGQSAIRFILENIDIKSDEYILMPAYLCPSILYNFKKLRVNYDFYRVNKDLSIDLDDIKEKFDKINVKAVFLIDYFGFYHNKKTIDYLEMLQKENIIIIEDAVQMLWFNRKEFIGNYVFNSYRKFLPIDGALVLSNKVENFNINQDKYYEYVNLARFKKTAYHNCHIGKEEEFLGLFEKAEKEYYKSECVLGMDTESKKMLSKINSNFIQNVREKNYAYLFNKLIQNSKIKIIYDKGLINDNIVLGLPILIENRDVVRKKLREYNIYCPVHWNILNEDWSSKYSDSGFVSSKIITLPIDQRYNFYDMNRLLDTLNRYV